MITGFYSKVKYIRRAFFLLLSTQLAAQPRFPKDQDWPKLMQLYEGRVVDVQYDSTGKEKYLDWKGSPVSGMNVSYDSKKTHYLYVDSTGKPLSNKLYQHATPFFGGLAAIWENDITADPDEKNKNVTIYKTKTAIINAREEEVLPMDEKPKYVLGKGLFVIDRRVELINTITEVYDKTGKKLAECTDCAVGIGVGMENFWMSTPKNSWRRTPVAKLLDLKGKVLYKGPGKYIEQVNNFLGSTGQFMISSMQPYYRVLKDDSTGTSIILDRKGEVVMDSIEVFDFSLGKCQIRKNGLAAIVDTNWRIIVPFSYGYTSIEALARHPQDAYIASKNNKTVVIDADNKKLIPLESTRGISYNYKQGYYYKAYDKEGNLLHVTLKGDTLINSVYYEVLREQSPYIPGFFVKCKSNGLKGYLDEHGKIVIPCQYDNLFYANANLVIFFGSDGTCGYMDIQGNIIFNRHDVIKLSSFSKGYAHCVIKVTDKKQFMTKEKILTEEGNKNYQLQDRVIDSTGKFVLVETWPASIRQFNKHLPDGSRIDGYFYKGVALVHNQKTNKYGLVNENLQVIAPVIYDAIDTLAGNFEYYWYTDNGLSGNIGSHSVTANIVNGKVKVTLKGVEKWIEVGK